MTAVWRAFFASSLVLLALLGLSVPYVEAGTATFLITVLSAAMLGLVFVTSATLIYFDWNPFDQLSTSH